MNTAAVRSSAEGPQTTEPAVPATLPPCPSPLSHPIRAIGWLVTLAAGVVSLLVILAVLAALPVASFVALGYMLEAEGRVVRSGRLRDGLPCSGLLPRLAGAFHGLPSAGA